MGRALAGGGLSGAGQGAASRERGGHHLTPPSTHPPTPNLPAALSRDWAQPSGRPGAAPCRRPGQSRASLLLLGRLFTAATRRQLLALPLAWPSPRCQTRRSCPSPLCSGRRAAPVRLSAGCREDREALRCAASHRSPRPPRTPLPSTAPAPSPVALYPQARSRSTSSAQSSCTVSTTRPTPPISTVSRRRPPASQPRQLPACQPCQPHPSNARAPAAARKPAPGWYGDDFSSRYNTRREHKAKVAAGTAGFDDLCGSAGVFLDSYLEVRRAPALPCAMPLPLRCPCGAVLPLPCSAAPCSDARGAVVA